MNLIRKAQARFGNILCKAMHRARIPACFTGYRHLSGVEPWISGKHGVRQACIVIDGSVDHYPLPFTINQAEALPSVIPQRLSLSFRDVLNMEHKPARRAVVSSARLLCCANEWERDSYALVSSDDHRFLLHGLEYRKGHVALLRKGKPYRAIDHAAWVLTRFPDSYFRWLTQILPRILMAEDAGVADRLLMPDEAWCTPFMNQSLEMMQVKPMDRVRPLDDFISCERLDVFDVDPFTRPLLERLRKRLVPDKVQQASRRVFISRRAANWRKLTNEDELWPLFERAGFERHVLEQMPFAEQCALMAETKVLWGLHGAGLANMIFCPSGAVVVEVGDPARPNPHFYALAVTLGHQYGLLIGEPGADHPQGVAYRDLSLSHSAVEPMLDQIDSLLSSSSSRNERT